jgi:hypothetical protein
VTQQEASLHLTEADSICPAQVCKQRVMCRF